MSSSKVRMGTKTKIGMEIRLVEIYIHHAIFVTAALSITRSATYQRHISALLRCCINFFFALFFHFHFA